MFSYLSLDGSGCGRVIETRNIDGFLGPFSSICAPRCVWRMPMKDVVQSWHATFRLDGPDPHAEMLNQVGT